MHQMELVVLEKLVAEDHVYRKIQKLFPLDAVREVLLPLEASKGADGFGIERLFKCLFLQFMEDLSDRGVRSPNPT